MTGEELFLANQPLIEAAIRSVCRRYGLRADEAEDFAQEVNLRLIEDDYRILRLWKGDGLKSYLAKVVARIWVDIFRKIWGKFRASEEAKDMGELAVELEALLVWKRYSLPEAFEYMRVRVPDLTLETLEELAARLPPRWRRQFEGEEELERLPGGDPGPEDTLLAEERRSLRSRMYGALGHAITTLPAEDQVFVRLKLEGSKISTIARVLHLEQKPLYRRWEGILASLRRGLGAEGFDGDDVRYVFELDAPGARETTSTFRP